MSNNMDERQKFLSVKSNRNSVFVTITFLLMTLVYFTHIKYDEYYIFNIKLYLIVATFLFVLSYWGLSFAYKMSYKLNLKVLKYDELEQKRLNSSIEGAGAGLLIFALINDIIIFFSKGINSIFTFHFSVILIYMLTNFISALIYRDITIFCTTKNNERVLSDRNFRIKQILKNSLRFSIVWTSIHYFFFKDKLSIPTSNLFVNAVIYFVGAFVLSFIFNSISSKVYLRIVKRIDKRIEE